ncbi:MAG: bifunctional oligoribonuclease/PAP phosphatase NrnA [Opitutae bacterium]|jgi:bifunctional oligoribonuclease and PAP phosphatase NrnA|nr:bifunctional oligoribonuclease/PAP phosphatase NrnA [Opitutae bacterium]
MTSFLQESNLFVNALNELRGKPVLVLGHRRPDGDCIGSQVGLTRILIELGIDARAVNQDPIPRTLKKFVGNTPFFSPEEIEGNDFTIVTVDCADKHRIGEELSKRFPQVFLNIDHHVSNNNYATINFVLSDASATGEILAKFFLDCEMKIDSITADALYVGIATDTGQFCYSGTNASVFEVCRRLCEYGADPSSVAHELYEREKPGRVQLLQRFLASFRMEHNERVCIGTLRDSYYKETNTHPEDAESFVDYARSMEGVEIGALLEERNGKIKGSLRAKDARYRVDILAKEFNGGGHACAAGFNVNQTWEEFYPKLVDAIGRHLAEAR